MGKDVISISCESFRNSDHRMEVTPKSDFTPFLQTPISPFRIPIILYFLQKTLDTHQRGMILIDLHLSFEYYFFIGQLVGFLLQRQALTLLKHHSPPCESFLVYTFPNQTTILSQASIPWNWPRKYLMYRNNFFSPPGFGKYESRFSSLSGTFLGFIGWVELTPVFYSKGQGVSSIL